jgi:hypothetical protein
MSALLPALAVAGVLGVGSAAEAVTIQLHGLNNSTLSASVDFQYDAATKKVTVALTNTSASSSNPYAKVTGFAFNLPTGVTGISAFSASGDASASHWGKLFKLDGVGTPEQVGKFDAGALSYSSSATNCTTNPQNCNINGGSTTWGLGLGKTGTFSFTLATNSLFGNNVTAQTFLNLLAAPDTTSGGKCDPGGPDPCSSFAVRFQKTGKWGNDSDVAAYCPPAGGGGSNGGSVPEPSVMLLVGTAVAAFASRARRGRA